MAEAVLSAYAVLKQLHERGVLEIMRGALAASDEILETVVDNVKTPEAIRAIRISSSGARLRQHRAGVVQGHLQGNSRRYCRGHRRT